MTPTHSVPVRIPDTKDWTWVLERPCPECGYNGTEITPDLVGERLLAAAEQLAGALDRADVQERPNPDTWSPLEYACHVRDVCRIFTERLGLMLLQDGPEFPNWDQDATCVEDDYNAQDPETVRNELLKSAHELALAWSKVPEDAWHRHGTRSDGARFTVLTLGRYLVHDPAHHAWDVTGALQG